MAKMEPVQAGQFCWIELATPDLSSAQNFYKALFKWQMNGHPMPNGATYEMINVADCEVGGAFELDDAMREEGMMPNWNIYAAVSNVDDATAQAKKLGATILREPFDVMEYGRMSVIQDPTGAVFCMWQSKEGLGEQPSPDQEGMFSWFELINDDVKTAAQFYSQLFNWRAKEQAMPNGHTYTTFTLNDKPVAGMIAKDPAWGDDVPNWWGVYFTTHNIDATVKNATKAGANVVYEPMDIPDVGRISMLTDPQNVHFSLFQPE